MKLTHTLTSISLECASQIAQSTLAHARQAGMLPLAVAVFDVRGTLKAYLAEDGTSLYRQEIAQGKALGALGMGFGGQELERRAGLMPLFMNAVQALTGGNLVPVQGGVLVRDAQGELLGAVGVSGELSSKDEQCAVAGIASVGLVADCGAPKQ
jgi:uncharacterized protein GlcG (DUF336 family)